MTDFGHAMAVVHALERQGETERAAKRKAAIEDADWRCRKCGAESSAAKSVCEHNFHWNYDIIGDISEPNDPRI